MRNVCMTLAALLVSAGVALGQPPQCTLGATPGSPTPFSQLPYRPVVPQTTIAVISPDPFAPAHHDITPAPPHKPTFCPDKKCVGCDCGNMCECGSGYAVYRKRAVAENKPLIVHVGIAAGQVMTETPNWLHCVVPSFADAKEPSVVVSVPGNGDLLRIADLPANATAAQVIQVVKNHYGMQQQSFLYQQQQAMYSGGFSGGACRGGG